MQINEIRTDKNWVDFAIANGPKTMQLLAQAEGAEQQMKNGISHLPRFAAEGNEQARVIYVGAEPSRFKEGEIVLCMYLWNETLNQGDWWRGSLSNDYMTGNNSGKTYMQGTIESLGKVGYDAYAAGGFGGLPQLIGQEIPIWVKRTEKNGKVYFNIGAIGSNFEAPPSLSLNNIGLGAPAEAAPAFGQPDAPAAPQSQPQFAPPPQQQPQQQYRQAPPPQQQPGYAQPAAPQPAFGPSPYGQWGGGNGSGL
jgi:hypothetical protein